MSAQLASGRVDLLDAHAHGVRVVEHRVYHEHALLRERDGLPSLDVDEVLGRGRECPVHVAVDRGRVDRRRRVGELGGLRRLEGLGRLGGLGGLERLGRLSVWTI